MSHTGHAESPCNVCGNAARHMCSSCATAIDSIACHQTHLASGNCTRLAIPADSALAPSASPVEESFVFREALAGRQADNILSYTAGGYFGGSGHMAYLNLDTGVLTDVMRMKILHADPALLRSINRQLAQDVQANRFTAGPVPKSLGRDVGQEWFYFQGAWAKPRAVPDLSDVFLKLDPIGLSAGMGGLNFKERDSRPYDN